MNKRKREIRLLFSAIGLGLFGCGFEPMLAVRNDDSAVADDFAKIRVAYIDNHAGQLLRTDLIDVLTPRGESSQPEYTLIIKILEPQQNLAYQRNNSVSNVGYGVQAYWTLQGKDGANLYSTSSASSTQYSVSSSQYATVASAQSTRERVMLDIVQDIRNKLAQYFISLKPKNAAASP